MIYVLVKCFIVKIFIDVKEKFSIINQICLMKKIDDEVVRKEFDLN